jgi:hypothetical protein
MNAADLSSEARLSSALRRPQCQNQYANPAATATTKTQITAFMQKV